MIGMREIFLIRIEDQQYAVWKDEIASVTAVQPLHRLPLSPSCIAGMSIVDGRTITLADLTACIGRKPASPDDKARVLMLSGNGKISGFLVTGDIDSSILHEEALVRMPGYLRTEVIGSCAILDSGPVPVINLRQLVRHLLHSGREQPVPSLSMPAAGPRSAPAAKFRLFGLNGELFAADAEDIEDAGVKTGKTATLSAVPRYVKGVVLHERTLLPLIDLARRMRLHPAENSAQMLVAKFSEVRFGLLVDQDLGVLSLNQVRLWDMPPLARSGWLSTALGHAGGIVPVIDIAALLAHAIGEEAPFEERYHPDSPFPSLFGAHEVDVVEFSLLGFKHAIPKAEVADVISCKPWRVLPGDAPKILIGVAEHEGEILPVLDLAMVFGRRSSTASEWQMMVVKNGDFRALVIAETVFGERRLPLDIQRAVPILVPHRVVYGCYPEAEGVRLILNVEALAVHFENSLVQELLPAMSAEMNQAHARTASSTLQEAVEPAQYLQMRAEPRSEALAPAHVSTGSALVKTAVSAEETDGSAEENHGAAEREPERTPEGSIEPADEQAVAEGAAGSAAIQEQKTEAAEALPEQAEPARVEGGAEEQTGAPSSESRATVEPKLEEAIVAVTPSVKTITEENREDLIAAASAPGVSLIEEEKIQEQAAPVEKTTISEAAVIETAEIGEKPPEQEAPVVAEPAAEPVQETLSIDAVAQEMPGIASGERDLQPELQEQAQTAPAAVPLGTTGATFSISATASEGDQRPTVQQPAHPRREEFQPAAGRTSPSYQPSHVMPSERSKKNWLPYAAAAIVLTGLLYFVGTSNKPSEQRKEPVIERAAILPAIPKGESAPLVQKHVPTPGPKSKLNPHPKPRPPLVLDIPKNLPLSAEVYIVVKGDTLWIISERFTGSPFNYPRIAGENRIANPDLIYPGQKIRLLKK